MLDSPTEIVPNIVPVHLGILDVFTHICVFQLFLSHFPSCKIHKNPVGKRETLIMATAGVKTEEPRAEIPPIVSEKNKKLSVFL